MDKLKELGEKLVNCDLHCDGITNDRDKYIIPRCLNLEKQKGGKTCIVIGLNPGKCKENERNYYCKNGIKYNSIIGYFNIKVKNMPLYNRTRELIKLFGYDGDILWTDLAKCECSEKTVPIQTLRTCISIFLRQEINLFRCDTIFALGTVAFNYCALSFPYHFIVGMPHPTGSHGNFIELNKKIISNINYYVKVIEDKKDDEGNYRAIHLSVI
jgi:hypothetical protein